MTFINKTCTNETCSNHGNCITATVKDRYNCNCEPGYFGKKCESDLITISTAKGTRSLKRGESPDAQLNITSYDGNVNVNVRDQNNVKINSVTTSNISSSNPSTTLTINIGPIDVPSTTILYKFVAGPQGNNPSYSRMVTLTLVVSDACDISPCKNGATCQYLTAEPYFNCTCQSEYNGTTCEELKYKLNGNCKYHVNYYYQKTFAEANTTCNSLGGTVAMMKTDAIQDLIESQIIALYGNGGDTIAFWIGAYKPHTDWLWVDGTPIINGKCWAWTDVSNEDGYLFMSSYATKRNNMKWFNNDGATTRGYVCEVPTVDLCSSNPCLFRGTCLTNGCQRTCKCSDGFTGNNCETKTIPTIAIVVTCVGIAIAVALVVLWIIKKKRSRNEEKKSARIQRSKDASTISPYETTVLSNSGSPSSSKQIQRESPYIYDNDTTCYEQPMSTIKKAKNNRETYENINPHKTCDIKSDSS
ncbi:uncharacterized protein LOC120336008 [Styela clava]